MQRFRPVDDLPSFDASIAYIKQLKKPLAIDVLRQARADKRVLVQPRCGVGGHTEMTNLLRELDEEGHADFLTLTIDSYTRLKRFDTAARLLKNSPSQLNGYPLLAHGWRAGRQLNESFKKPLQIRHGSPDASALFDLSLASGFSSFEGGGISYNLPYCKDVPLETSLRSWQLIDRKCGALQNFDVTIDREFFGSLSGVIVPPSISLAVIFLEAILAAQEGCTCLSLAIPQNGCIVQDVAALRVIPKLARMYLPDEVEVFPVLHQFMGVFPKDIGASRQLIFLGGMTARIGAATKTITKTTQEAIGIPDGPSNVDGLRTTLSAHLPQFETLEVRKEDVEDEMYWLVRETKELLDPVLQKGELISSIIQAFHNGSLDIPFPANREAHGAIIPVRDDRIAVRYARFGRLPFSRDVKMRNEKCLKLPSELQVITYNDVLESIQYFANQRANYLSVSSDD